mmetsp:Transcript_173/g.341  ORF Transcript_173/g.341 Transcript_173/m.341 type:complete len:139 (-) Transcript_173:714-1130(-)
MEEQNLSSPLLPTQESCTRMNKARCCSEAVGAESTAILERLSPAKMTKGANNITALLASIGMAGHYQQLPSRQGGGGHRNDRGFLLRMSSSLDGRRQQHQNWGGCQGSMATVPRRQYQRHRDGRRWQWRFDMATMMVA